MLRFSRVGIAALPVCGYLLNSQTHSSCKEQRGEGSFVPTLNVLTSDANDIVTVTSHTKTITWTETKTFTDGNKIPQRRLSVETDPPLPRDPQTWRKLLENFARDKSEDGDWDKCVDFIVVGAGSAGCAAATRISQSLPYHCTLLLEAGFDDDIPQIQSAVDYFGKVEHVFGSERDWVFGSEAQATMTAALYSALLLIRLMTRLGASLGLFFWRVL